MDNVLTVLQGPINQEPISYFGGRKFKENGYIVNDKIKYYTNYPLGEGHNSKFFAGKYASRIVAIQITEKNKEELHNEIIHLLRCTQENVIRFYGFEKLDNYL